MAVWVVPRRLGEKDGNGTAGQAGCLEAGIGGRDWWQEEQAYAFAPNHVAPLFTSYIQACWDRAGRRIRHGARACRAKLSQQIEGTAGYCMPISEQVDSG